MTLLALGHLTVTDELLMPSTSGLSDDARRGVAEDNNIPYSVILKCQVCSPCVHVCGNASIRLKEFKRITELY